MPIDKQWWPSNKGVPCFDRETQEYEFSLSGNRVSQKTPTCFGGVFEGSKWRSLMMFGAICTDINGLYGLFERAPVGAGCWSTSVQRPCGTSSGRTIRVKRSAAYVQAVLHITFVRFKEDLARCDGNYAAGASETILCAVETGGGSLAFSTCV